MSGKEKNKGAKRLKNIHEFFENIFVFLKYLGYFSYIHKTLINKLLNILKMYIISIKEKMKKKTQVYFWEVDGNGKGKGWYKLHKKFDALFIKFFFLCLVNEDEKGSTFTEKLWSVLRLLPASRRFHIYSKFFKKLEMYKINITSLKQIKEKRDNEEKNRNSKSNLNRKTDMPSINSELTNKVMDTLDHSLNKLRNNKQKTKQLKPSSLSARSLVVLSIMNFEVMKHRLRTIIKRITSDILKDRYNAKVQTMLQQLTKIVNINPFISADIILQQCELFDNNMIITLAESVKRISNFSSDIFLYKIVERQQLLKVANYKMYKVKNVTSEDSVDDFIYKPKRLINLSLMSAKFLAKHPAMPFYPLLISTIKRIFSEFHNTDRIYLHNSRKNKNKNTLLNETGTHGIITSSSEPLAEKSRRSKQMQYTPILKASNKKYPNEMIGYLFDLDYIQKLLEIYGETGGFVNVQEMTDDQLNAQCGYKTLRKEIMVLEENLNSSLYIGDSVDNANFEKWEKMQSEDEQLKSLCIRNASKTFLNANYIYLIFFMLSKMKYEFVYDSNTTNIKNISSLFDRIHGFLLQFIDFLQMNSDADLYLDIVPNAKVLFRFFENVQAFHILRFAFPFFTKRKKIHTEKSEKELATSRKYTDKMRLMEDFPEFDLQNEEKWKQIVIPILEKCSTIEHLKGINSLFCVTFWRLDISDIYVPHKQYLKVISKYDKIITDLDKVYEENKGNDKYSWVHKKIKKLRLKKMNINNEYDRQVYHTNRIKRYLSRIVEHWVDPEEIEKETFVLFTKHLIAPRILYSEKDALFCSKFLLLLLEFETPLFNFCVFTYICTKMLIPLINTCTEREALNLGIFFNDFYSYIYLLCNDVSYFQKNTNKNPCFAYNLNFQSRDTISHSYILEKVLKWEKMIVTLLFKKKNYEKSWISSKALVIFLFRFFKSFPNSKSIKATMKIYLTFLKDFAQSNGWRDIVISVNSLITDIERHKRIEENEKKQDTHSRNVEHKSTVHKSSANMFLKKTENVTMNPFSSSSSTPLHTNQYYMPLVKNLYSPNPFSIGPNPGNNSVISNTYGKEGTYSTKGGVNMDYSNHVNIVRRNNNFVSDGSYMKEGSNSGGMNNHSSSNVGNKRRDMSNRMRKNVNTYNTHSHSSNITATTTKNAFTTHPSDVSTSKKMRVDSRNTINDGKNYQMNQNYVNTPLSYSAGTPSEDDSKPKNKGLSHIHNYLKNNRNTSGYYRK